jgi:hypothetical protein
VICAYQVVQEQGQHGDQTAYSQQFRMMRLEGNSAPKPRRQFIHDLKAFIKSLKQSNRDILLMGDFNESIGVNPAGMASGSLTDVSVIGTDCIKKSQHMQGDPKELITFSHHSG